MIYTAFASMYDEFMQDIPYEKWGIYITKMLRKHLPSKEDILVADLACGTGTMTIFLAKQGFDMIGVDMSYDMLAAAQQKAYEEKQNILFLAQKVQELDLFGTADAMVSVCDGLNYILNEEELAAAFKKVSLFLNPGGIFIFDMNTEYKFKELLGCKSFEGDSQSGSSYEWDNFYSEETQINEYRVQFFKEKSESYTEVHKQRAYSPETVVAHLKNAGFCDVSVYHEYTDQPPKPDSLRLTFLAQ